VRQDTEKRRATKAEPKRLVSVEVDGTVVLDDNTELRVAASDRTRVSAWQPPVEVRIEPPRNPANRPFQLMINEVTGEAVSVIVRELPDLPSSQLVRVSNN
jgi:hypothetical protein